MLGLSCMAQGTWQGHQKATTGVRLLRAWLWLRSRVMLHCGPGARRCAIGLEGHARARTVFGARALAARAGGGRATLPRPTTSGSLLMKFAHSVRLAALP